MSKRILRAVLGVVMLAGVVVALWPLGQSVYANWNQQQLRAQWERGEQATKNEKRETVAAARLAPPANGKPPRTAWPPTRLVIPDADVDVIVLDGWDEQTLQRAPGHWPASAAPGQAGNCAIAGHRNVYGSPFYKVDSLQPGAAIELRTPQATHLYRVIEIKAVTDADTTILKPSPDPKMPPLLTLVTCTLPRTSNRIVVSAALEPAT